MSNLLKAVGYSPEELGDVIGISGMTLRRWLKKPKRAPIPRAYVPAIRDACYRLIAEGRLDPGLPVVQAMVSEMPSAEHQAALRNLGLHQGFKTDQTGSQNQVVAALLHVGIQTSKQTEVNMNVDKVFSFKKLGDEWARRIAILWKIIHSKKIDFPSKLVAYGALFYLLTPIDFIPDQIPFFGLLDDFGVLGIAVTYYTNRFG